MKVINAKLEGKKLVVEFEGGSHTLFNLIREKIWEVGGEAAYRMEHPLKNKFTLLVVADKPKEVLKKAIEAAKKEVAEFRKKVEALKV